MASVESHGGLNMGQRLLLAKVYKETSGCDSELACLAKAVWRPKDPSHPRGHFQWCCTEHPESPPQKKPWLAHLEDLLSSKRDCKDRLQGRTPQGQTLPRASPHGNALHNGQNGTGVGVRKGSVYDSAWIKPPPQERPRPQPGREPASWLCHFKLQVC